MNNTKVKAMILLIILVLVGIGAAVMLSNSIELDVSTLLRKINVPIKFSGLKNQKSTQETLTLQVDIKEVKAASSSAYAITVTAKPQNTSLIAGIEYQLKVSFPDSKSPINASVYPKKTTISKEISDANWTTVRNSIEVNAEDETGISELTLINLTNSGYKLSEPVLLSTMTIPSYVSMGKPKAEFVGLPKVSTRNGAKIQVVVVQN